MLESRIKGDRHAINTPLSTVGIMLAIGEFMTKNNAQNKAMKMSNSVKLPGLEE